MNLFELFLGPSLISATLRLTVPILFVAVGGCFGSKANVFNIGLESYLGISAFFAMCGSYWSQSPWVGLLLGMLAGLVMSCIFAVFVLYFESDTMVVGIALNLASWGITTFLLSAIFNVRGVFIDPRIKSFQTVEIPLIKEIPYIGAVVSGHNVLVYLAVFAVIAAHIVMFKTPFGLRLRGIGIKEAGAASVGVNTMRYKWQAILLGGLLGGMSGAFLTIGGASMFTEKISGGYGYLALAAIMVGDAKPVKTMLACLVFGYVSAQSVALQSMKIPSQVVLSMPYLITVLILTVNAVLLKYKTAGRRKSA